MRRMCNNVDYNDWQYQRHEKSFKHPQLYEKMLEGETSAKKSKAQLVNILSNIRDVKTGLNICFQST